MKALAKLEHGPGLTLTRVKKPEVGHNDVLIRIRKTAICGTDMHIWNWDEWAQKTIPVPMHVGHEYVGEIEEIGQEVRGFKIGDRVSGEGHITCGFCRNCRAGRRHLCRNTVGLGVNRDGAFAEYVTLPASNVWVHRMPVDLDVAAIFDPFGNAVHTALTFPLLGEDVLITGAGPIGIMAAAVARHAGGLSKVTCPRAASVLVMVCGTPSPVMGPPPLPAAAWPIPVGPGIHREQPPMHPSGQPEQGGGGWRGGGRRPARRRPGSATVFQAACRRPDEANVTPQAALQPTDPG